MMIGYDIYDKWIIFTLESKDFIKERGHKFINELKMRLEPDSYITYEYAHHIIWMIEDTQVKTFQDIYKKYFPKEFENQKVKIICS